MAALWCVVPAAGRGTRVGGDCPKQYLPLGGRALILHTLDRLAAHPRIAGLLVVLAAGDQRWPGIGMLGGKPVLSAVGGGERADSVLAGLRALPPEVGKDDFVLVHDAARPCVRASDIDRLIDLGSPAGGGLLGAPLRDTLKRADANGRSALTEPREQRWRAFTPQMFRHGQLVAALEAASRDGVLVSDEAMAMERAGHAPMLVEGAEDNIKVTTAADFALAEFLLSRTG
ncbi:MAG: 2-C-methyl-D-erythritol 4-phosphate cytidylyltransferase [Frateuria sp.]|uniref:2-C-methyl-D-erythritol 4-phosphate cytidylyltransferase n=1 Tax=Frateuria sp. TaxID=2211372 RepID=UPI001846B703|nr:2-C-methyl-D-erythritol 4-phosphate cytidylyltransferase [Frateuria sp.]NUO73932.1 2-C-methyl-D-erythritol 4-phosphate cytidylyltransferase [Frateuria sp.]NUR23084.1 2-C-methyl-D-erythritol 4-phosphate cytidylyltransferase [Frateuria sp.]